MIYKAQDIRQLDHFCHVIFLCYKHEKILDISEHTRHLEKNWHLWVSS